MDNLRRAILLFTVIVFTAAAVTGFMAALDYYDASKSVIKDIEFSGEKYVPPEGETSDDNKEELLKYNILFIIGDKNVKSSEIISVMNYDEESKKISTLYIPCDTKYSLNSGNGGVANGALRDCYSLYGGEQTTLILSGMMDINISKYVYMDYENFASFVNHFTSRDSGVEFELPVAINYTDNNGNKVSLRAGKQFFDGNAAKQLAMFCTTDDGIYDAELLKYYDGTQTGRIRIMSIFTESFIEQKIIDPQETYYSENFYSLLYSVKSGCETNITDSELLSLSQGIAEFKKGCTDFYRIICEDETGSGKFCIYTKTCCVAGGDGSEFLDEAETSLLYKNNFNSN